MATAGLTSIGGNEVEAGRVITLAPQTLYFGINNFSMPQQLTVSRGAPMLTHAPAPIECYWLFGKPRPLATCEKRALQLALHWHAVLTPCRK